MPPPIPKKKPQVVTEQKLPRHPPIPNKKPQRPAVTEEKLPSSTTRDQDIIAQAKVEQRASSAFQMRNDLESAVAQENRSRERNRIHNFQNRTGRLTSSAIAREKARIETARDHGQTLTQELLLTALAKRRFGGGLPNLGASGGEQDLKKYLEDRFGGTANAGAQAQLFNRLVGELPLPRRASGSGVKQTRIQPQPQPEPEPEPSPFESEWDALQAQNRAENRP